MKKVILGVGTGRCGTMSLSNLLNLQKNSNFTHELDQKDRLPWEINLDKFNHYLESIITREKSFVGDVSFYLLPYVHFVLEKFPDSKIIILQRDKEQTVSSYLKKVPKRNHWMPHRGFHWFLDPNWDPCYPKFQAKTKKEAIAMYYDLYYETCKNLITQKPNNLFWIKTEDLNNEQRCLEMLEFCGFEEPIWEKSHKNKGK